MPYSILPPRPEYAKDACAAFDFGDGDYFGLWLSLVERLPRVQEAAGSNPASPMLSACPRRPILLRRLSIGLDRLPSLR